MTCRAAQWSPPTYLKAEMKNVRSSLDLRLPRSI